MDNAQYSPTGPPEPRRTSEFGQQAIKPPAMNAPWHPDERPPRPVYDAPAWRLNTGQLSVLTTAPLEIAGNNPTRLALVITNADSTNPIAIADSGGVTVGTGHLIPAGVSLTLTHYRGPVFAIAKTATVVVTYAEETI